MTLTDEEIPEFLDRLEKESRAIKKNLLEMCWHMRGGLSYDDAMLLSYHEREMINDIIKDHMDVTKKTQLPFF